MKCELIKPEISRAMESLKEENESLKKALDQAIREKDKALEEAATARAAAGAIFRNSSSIFLGI